MFYETSAQVLDALRLKLGTDRDADVARALGIAGQAVSHYRKGRFAMSPRVAMKAAEILGLPAAPVVLAQLAASEDNQEVRAMFQELAVLVGQKLKRAKRHVTALAFTLIGLGLAGAPAPSEAYGVSPVNSYTHYTKYERLRRWRRNHSSGNLFHALARRLATWLPIHVPAL